MSTTMFMEATSADPFVRDVYRKAVRLLNDPTLDRRQREFHIRRLQSNLIAHYAAQDAKVNKLKAKKASREQVVRGNHHETVANPSQVAARRKELRATESKQEEAEVQTSPALIAANDSRVTGRNRPVLTLKRA
jgi:hypothetical protein